MQKGLCNMDRFFMLLSLAEYNLVFTETKRRKSRHIDEESLVQSRTFIF
jgi:hypothetical protein